VADEWIGMLHSQDGIGVTFQQGQFICAEYATSHAGFVSDGLGPKIAITESQKIYTAIVTR
jgi:hypothetical protein